MQAVRSRLVTVTLIAVATSLPGSLPGQEIRRSTPFSELTPFSQLTRDPGRHFLDTYRQRHRALRDAGDRQDHGYRAARQFMFSTLDNEDGKVEGFYSGKEIRTRDIPDHTVMNTEHTFAQSWFRHRLPPQDRGRAKSDLHHLFPTLSYLNSRRGSLPFGEVSSHVSPFPGGSRCDGDHFEPRDSVKGNVARALFYFSAAYGISIPDNQEHTLRTWHGMDPVDPPERQREELIFGFQGNRNPFVRNPDLVDAISDF